MDAATRAKTKLPKKRMHYPKIRFVGAAAHDSSYDFPYDYSWCIMVLCTYGASVNRLGTCLAKRTKSALDMNPARPQPKMTQNYSKRLSDVLAYLCKLYNDLWKYGKRLRRILLLHFGLITCRLNHGRPRNRRFAWFLDFWDPCLRIWIYQITFTHPWKNKTISTNIIIGNL